MTQLCNAAAAGVSTAGDEKAGTPHQAFPPLLGWGGGLLLTKLSAVSGLAALASGPPV